MRAFISYARTPSSAAAVALRDALQNKFASVFLDTSDIEDAAEFPRAIVDGILEATVFLAIVDSSYTRRWYCLRELQLAMAAVARARSEGKEGPRIVITVAGDDASHISELPPDLAMRNWPPVSDISRVTELLEAEIPLAGGTFGTFLKSYDPAVIALTEAPRLPAPRDGIAARVLPAGLPPSCHDAFVGRADELSRIHFALTSSAPHGAEVPRRTVLLEGFAGVGKSQLAAEYVHRCGDHYSGGIFYLTAGVSAADFERQLTELAIRVAGHTATSAGNPRQALRRWAAAHASEPILLVVDNVPHGSRSHGTDVLAHWCPLIGAASVLATSRDRRARYDGDVRGIEVLPLPVESAVALLASGPNPPHVDDALWRDIAVRAGRLPLALRLLNAVLDTSSPRQILDRLQKSSLTELDDAYHALAAYLPFSEAPSVIAAFTITADALSPAAFAAAFQFALLAPAPIPMTIASKVADRSTLGELVRRGVITPSGGGRGEMYGQLHRLFAEYVLARRTRRQPWWQGVQDLLPLRLQPREIQMRRTVGSLSASFASVLKELDVIEEIDVFLATAPHVEWLYQRLMETQPFPQPAQNPMLFNYGKCLDNLVNASDTREAGLASVRNVLRRIAADDAPELRGDLAATFAVAVRLSMLQTPPSPTALDLYPLGEFASPSSNEFGYIVERLSPDVAEAWRRRFPKVQEVFEFRREFLGPTDIGTIRPAYDLAHGYLHLGDLETARHWFTIVAELCTLRDGAEGANTLVAQWHLLLISIAIGEPAAKRLSLELALMPLLGRSRADLSPPLRVVRLLLVIIPELKGEKVKRVFSDASTEELHAYTLMVVRLLAFGEVGGSLFDRTSTAFTKRALQLKKKSNGANLSSQLPG
jgi:hypothetical protein